MNRFGATVLVLITGVTMGLGACTPANKVKKTLALNDLHIRAAVAEDKGKWDQAYELWSE